MDLRDDGWAQNRPAASPNIRRYRTCDLVIFYLHEKAGRCFNQSIIKNKQKKRFSGILCGIFLDSAGLVLLEASADQFIS